MKKNPYETRNKIVKYFTILVIVAFLLSVVASGIVFFFGSSSKTVEKANVVTKKEVQEVNNQTSQPGKLIVTGDNQ